MCRPHETYFAIEANASIFANMSEAAVARLIQLGVALPIPPASPRDSGHPRCGAHGTWVSSLALTALTRLLATSDIVCELPLLAPISYVGALSTRCCVCRAV